MTTPPPLSPAAQAVLDASKNAYDGEYIDGVWVVDEHGMIAAAIRALVEQTLPEEPEPPVDSDGWPWPPAYQQMSDAKWEQRQQTSAEQLAIAAELDGGNTPTETIND